MPSGFARKFISAIASVPNEVFSVDTTLGIVKTSSNFAIVKTSETEFEVYTSQRSLEDADRARTTEKIKNHFAGLGAVFSVTGVYPGWPANPESEPAKVAAETYRTIYGKLPGVYAIHAGLEAGVFTKKNPSLRILSFSPAETDCHTERESLNIAEFNEFNKLLRLVVENAAQKGS